MNLATTTIPAGSAVAALRGARVLLAHDWIAGWAGSERVVAELLEIFPDADLVVGMVAPKVRQLNEVTRRARETWMARLPGARTHHRWFLPVEPLAFATLPTRGYDLVVSSSHAFAKAVRAPRGALHVCYCHSPPRYLYDLGDQYRREATMMQRVAMSLGTSGMRAVDRLTARGVDHFVSNSRYVSARIRRAYGRESSVVYPPVQPKPGAVVDAPRDPFVLHLGRLVPYKRVDLAIQAAERVGVRLVIAGDGPERAKLARMAGPHTEFVGMVSEQEASRLLSTCSAFVFCAEEDFGIAPVEANAHGAPVVGLGRGGLLESMVPGVTAELFPDPEPEGVAAALDRALGRRWDPKALVANAERFAPEHFREAFARAVLRAAGGDPARDA